LNLEPAKISTQVLSRVVIAKFLTSIALGASVLERISKEIRNLQRSEINEWIEPFKSNQVGSSAMPHKRNPHKSERISGLSRIVRNNVSVALENISLEHERDITHSSVERIIIPASLNLFYFMVSEMNYILSNLEINLDSVNLNLMKSQGKDKSEEILTILSSKISRQEAHELLRNHVNSENFQLSVLDDTNITSLIDKEILKNIFANTKTGLSVGKTEDILKLYKSEWSNYRV
jgi:adenylosuccinate lyase